MNTQLWRSPKDGNDEASIDIDLVTGQVILETYHWGRDTLTTVLLTEDDVRVIASAFNTYLQARSVAP